eukprot:CAMPEP_0171244556 /NCGR_PEP_ID=MMETSP0790-20130122/46920_1 /TAXON_ID=2925 /ORGANISM="Alexandrium catenella, Strain OF101" /LENGTH=248 /DNA_ID=CAMNT_0011711697 /DNA_START=78 /DNA_END=824 /DNA_ORIENTATION=+
MDEKEKFKHLYHRQLVESLFDDYAETFEDHLVESLGYRGPEAIREVVGRLTPAESDGMFGTVVDLGCGTGLCGAVVRGVARRLVGVDISSGMAEVARQKGRDGQAGSPGELYDELVVRDAAAACQAMPEGSADLVIAGDMFIYVWDMSRMLAAVARILRPTGTFIFTTERMEEGETEEGWVERVSERFAHSQSFISRALADAGLQLTACEASDLRGDGVSADGERAFVPGDLYVVCRLQSETAVSEIV